MTTKLNNSPDVNHGKLILIPSGLGGEEHGHTWPASHLGTIAPLRHFIVENVRSARRFLRQVGYSADFNEVEFFLIDKHSPGEDISAMLQPLLSGKDTGLLSEAGLPCVADPGNRIVLACHRKNIKVVPLVGASSVMMALMASGFNGQRFCFHGYLPIERSDRISMLKQLEHQAGKTGITQIFMETPFRNMALIKLITEQLNAETLLCIACDLSLKSEFVHTAPLSFWKKNMPELHKRPGMFLLGRE